LLGRSVVERIGGVGSYVKRDIILSSSVAIVVVNWDPGAINRQLFKVRSAMSVQLGVQVGVDAPLEKRIFGEVDSADNVARLELEHISQLYAAFSTPLKLTMTCSVSAK
jgi:hypothetical protein